MKDRLKELRKDLNYSQEEMGNRLGVNKATISRLEKGINNITEQMIKSICREFNVSESWFRTGEGDMYVLSSYNDKLTKALAEISLSQNEKLKDVVQKLTQLDDKFIDSIDILIDGILQKNNIK